MTSAPLRRVESSFRAPDGLRLHCRAWLPPHPERALLVVHGYAEHCGRYEELARWFAARGCAVHAYDHRGHGRSQGTRAHVRSFDDLLDDLEAMLARVREAHPELPLTVVGHSMGGLVTASLLVQRAPSVHGAVLSGAALALGDGVSALRVGAARVMRSVLPKFVIGSGLDPNGLSRDPEVVRRYLEDPLVFRTMTSSLAAEILRAVPRAAAGADRVAVPLLVLHGEDDPICPAAGSHAFAAGAPDSTLQIYPGLRHEIFNEPEREQVFVDVHDWLEAGDREEARA